MDKLLEQYRREAELLNEANDCGVRALAATTGISYKLARSALGLQGRKSRNGTYINVLWSTLEWMGAKVLWDEHRGGRPPTVTRFLKEPPEGTLIAITRKHGFAVVDGKVKGDWIKKGNRHRVLGYIKITKPINTEFTED